ncbi:hypothetical protein XfCFBP8078_12455, partial [Xylella fastidiosa subsp. multiplex]
LTSDRNLRSRRYLVLFVQHLNTPTVPYPVLEHLPIQDRMNEEVGIQCPWITNMIQYHWIK